MRFRVNRRQKTSSVSRQAKTAAVGSHPRALLVSRSLHMLPEVARLCQPARRPLLADLRRGVATMEDLERSLPRHAESRTAAAPPQEEDFKRKAPPSSASEEGWCPDVPLRHRRKGSAPVDQDSRNRSHRRRTGYGRLAVP